MTEQNKNPQVESGLSHHPPAIPKLLTRQQVILALKQEIESSSLTAVAKQYDLAAQQVSDVVHGRANLSKRVLSKLRLKMHVFYERGL